MRTVAAIPVKPFDQAKRRLSAALSPLERRHLGEQLARHTVEVAAEAGAVPLVLSADDEVTDWARSQGIDVLLDEGSSLDQAAVAAQKQVLAAGDAWMVVHADLPLLRPNDLEPVVAHLAAGGRAIAPSSDGGTSLLGAPVPISPSYGPGSFHRHLVRLGPDARVFVTLGLALDLDTVSDLSAAMRHRRGAWMT
jgi:2-phospho-L-lactate/phosphoenolpyruvate guanylyltransferase